MSPFCLFMLSITTAISFLLQYPHELSPPAPPTSMASYPVTSLSSLHQAPPPPPPAAALRPVLPSSPPSMPTSGTSSAEAVCEAAARLLFMNVKWMKNVPAFMSLPFADQCLLLEESWRELFVLAAAQFQMPIDPAPLFAAAGACRRKIGIALRHCHANDTECVYFFRYILGM